MSDLVVTHDAVVLLVNSIAELTKENVALTTSEAKATTSFKAAQATRDYWQTRCLESERREREAATDNTNDGGYVA